MVFLYIYTWILWESKLRWGYQYATNAKESNETASRAARCSMQNPLFREFSEETPSHYVLNAAKATDKGMRHVDMWSIQAWVSIACSYYLLGDFNHLDKIWKSMGRMTSPILWKIKAMFETTNIHQAATNITGLSPTTHHRPRRFAEFRSDPRGIKSKLQRHHIFRLHIPKAGAHTDANWAWQPHFSWVFIADFPPTLIGTQEGV